MRIQSDMGRYGRDQTVGVTVSPQLGPWPTVDLHWSPRSPVRPVEVLDHGITDHRWPG